MMYGGNAMLQECLNWYDVQIFLWTVALIDLSYFPDDSWNMVGSKCRFVVYVENIAILR